MGLRSVHNENRYRGGKRVANAPRYSGAMSAAPDRDDVIQPFGVDGLDAAGRIVRLGPAVDTILGRHGYPGAVSVLLGEALALTAALAGSLKFDGGFTTQIQGEGPVRLMVADYRTDGGLRGYAGFDAKRIPEDAPGAPGDAGLFGRGRMAFTIDRGPDADRHQGLVALEGGTLEAGARGYLARSEQTRALVAAAAARRTGEDGAPARWRAGAATVRQLPRGDGRSEAKRGARDARWRETRRLFAGLERADLVDSPARTPLPLGPLFAGHDVRLRAPRELRAACRCSRSRAAAAVEAIPPSERAALAVDGRIEVTCDYCAAVYAFDAEGAAPCGRGEGGGDGSPAVAA